MSKRKVHILILSSWYPSEDHPFLGNFIQRQAKLLATKYEVTLVNTEAIKELKSVEIQKVNFDGMTEIRVCHPSGKHAIQKLLHQRKALNEAFKELKEVDLIIGAILLPKGIQFIQAKKHFKCPLIYTEQGSYFRKEIKSTWSFKDKLILQSVRRHIDHIVPVSHFLKDDLLNDFALKKYTIIGNHVNTESFCYVSKEQRAKTSFLHISTLDANTKNPSGIFEACKLLKEYTNQFALTVICDEDANYWKNWCAENELLDVIDFVGPQNWLDLPKFYHATDAFILFSVYESFSVVLAEAWSTGTPTLTTEVGIASKMPSELGVLVQQDNPESLANAMLKIIKREIVFEGEIISNYGQQFSEKCILRKWEELIDEYMD
jgi:glycosyltransferase involved in cell wall biosynthesis